MRILYIPFFSNSSNHNGCSIYNTMKVFFRSLVDSDESVYVYFLVPDNIPYAYDDDYLNHPRIEKIFIPYVGKDQYDEKCIVPEKLYELFNADIGKYYYDLVVCDKAQIANLVKIILSRKFIVGGEEDYLPYVTLTQFIIKKEGRFGKIIDEVEFSHCTGWMSGWNMFENKRNMDVCMSVARKYLQPAYVSRMIERSSLNNVYGVNTKRLDTFYKGNNFKVGDEIRINFANRTASHYKFEEVLDIIDYLYKSGLNIKLIITTPTSSFGSYAKKRIDNMKKNGLKMELYTGLGQEEFYKIASGCHLFISKIDELQSPNAYMEQMYFGQIGILPQEKWVNHFFPDYECQFNNFNEAFSLVKEFSKNPDKFREYNTKIREYLRNEYDISNNAVKTLGWLKEKVLPYYTINNDAQIRIIKEIFDKLGWPDQITYEEFCELLNKNSQTKIDLSEPTFKRVNKFDFIKGLVEMGYQDTLEPVLKFKRVK